MKLSLGVLLAFCLAGLQFLAVLLVVSSSYLTSEKALLNHARDLLRDVGTNTIEHSKGFLNPARGAAELAARLAQNRVVASDDPVLLEQLLFQQLQIAPQFAGLYFGGEDGNFVMVSRTPGEEGPFRTKIINREGGRHDVTLIWRNNDFAMVKVASDPADPYDPRTRPWYKQARTDLTTVWTDPYIFFSSQQPGITLAAPVLKTDGTVAGAIGVDIEISMISDFLSRLRIGSNGKALIINRNGDVIAHPQLDMIKARNDDGTLRFANITEFEDPVARAAFAPLAADGHMNVQEETAAQFTYDGASYVSTVMPAISDQLPWTIAVYAPENDFTAVIKQNRLINIWIAALVAGLTGLLGLVLANVIHRPVRAFAVRAALIAQGEIDPDSPAPHTYNELERANDALVQQIVARREAEREFGQSFELSNRAMAQVSAVDGAIIRANAAFGALVGAAPEDCIGRKVSDVAHPDDLARYGCHVDGRDEVLPNQDMRWTRRDGAEIWVRLNSIIIRDAKGQPMHGILTVDDITEERARDHQITQLSRDLAHLARGNTMGQMAAGLAHELNQPLTAIAQNADSALMSLQASPGTDPELTQIVTEIEHQSLRAGEIIRALRGFIRKDEGGQIAFDFPTLLEQTQRLVHAEAVEAGVIIRAALAPLPPVLANRVQIAQVLVNLLRNAIESIAAGQDNHRNIAITSRISDGMALICVEDSGPGIAPNIQLFTQFETSKPEGLGLGLSICRNMVEANGGRLWNEETSGRGARFCFTLPLQVT